MGTICQPDAFVVPSKTHGSFMKPESMNVWMISTRFWRACCGEEQVMASSKNESIQWRGQHLQDQHSLGRAPTKKTAIGCRDNKNYFFTNSWGSSRQLKYKSIMIYWTVLAMIKTRTYQKKGALFLSHTESVNLSIEPTVDETVVHREGS